MIEIKPQKGKQELFLSTEADIAIYGGSAGGGKTFSLLMEPLRHIDNPRFGGVIFRRESPQITTEGGLLDESKNMYPYLGGKLILSPFRWTFPSKAKIEFRHLQHEKDIFSWQGAQIPFIGFDELTHFTRKQFIYMLSRNRSTCGIKPYIRGTCNPDPDSFVADLIEWWIGDDGYAIEERAGVIRYFIVVDDVFKWADTPEELIDKYTTASYTPMPKSFTFIPASVQDNQILLKNNPEYLANLHAQSKVDRERLLEGNWKVRPSSGMYFKREYFKIIEEHELPSDRNTVRAWDLAATEKTESNDPDATAGVKMSRCSRGYYYIEDLRHMFSSPAKVEDSVYNTATLDGKETRIRLPQDPGQAGKAQAQKFIKQLSGYPITSKPVTGDKVTRSAGFSSQCEHGNVFIVKNKWNNTLISELEAFPEGKHDDIVDACSDAFDELNNRKKIKRTIISGV